MSDNPTRKEDFNAARRLMADPMDALSVHLSLTMGLHVARVGYGPALAMLANYVAQYISHAVDSPANAAEVVDRFTEYVKDVVAGKISAEEGKTPDLKIN